MDFLFLFCTFDPSIKLIQVRLLLYVIIYLKDECDLISHHIPIIFILIFVSGQTLLRTTGYALALLGNNKI